MEFIRVKNKKHKMKEVQETKTLLSDVSKAIQKYDEEYFQSGKTFNIFTVLEIGHLEKVHSAILAELLNPNGSHGQKDGFLKLFYKACNLNYDVSIEKRRVVRNEVSVGLVSEDYCEGGRIDLLVEIEGENSIVIENKIHALDQKNQLVRYRKAYPTAQLFYLTIQM